MYLKNRKTKMKVQDDQQPKFPPSMANNQNLLTKDCVLKSDGNGYIMIFNGEAKIFFQRGPINLYY